MERKDYILIVLAIAIVFTATLPGLLKLFQQGYPPSWGGDSYGHLFKIWKLYNYGWKPWIEDWYSGYPFLRFYPPLSYITAYGLAKIVSDPVNGYKLLVSLIPLTSAITMYLAMRISGFGKISSFIASVIYSTNPWIFRAIAPEGNLPRAFGFAVAPLILIALHIVFHSNKINRILLAGLLTSIVILAHHTLALSITISFLGIMISLVIMNTSWVSSWRKTVSRLAMNIALLTVSIMLTACFWLIPFATDIKYASFISETHDPYLFRLQSVKPAKILDWYDQWSYFQGYTRLLAPLILLSIAIYRRDKAFLASSIFIILMYIAFIVLALGAYGPTPWLNQLPLIDLIPPYRWLDSLQPLYAYTYALAIESINGVRYGGRRIRYTYIAIFIAILILIAIAEMQPRLEFLSAENFDRDLAAALNFIGGDNTSGWRFYQWGLGISKGSMVGYSPAIAHKPSIDGWYRQGDPLYIMHGELGWALTHDARYAEKLLKIFGVKYVIIDESLQGSDRAIEILKSIGFQEVFRSNKIVVYMGNNTIFNPLPRRVMAITCSPDVVRYIFPDAEIGKSCYLDDYDAETLYMYNTVILYDYRYGSPDVWRKLLDYVYMGGILIVDTYRSPDSMRSIPGTDFRSEIFRYRGIATIEIVNSGIYNLHLEYENESWVSTLYNTQSGNRVIVFGNRTVVGFTRYGNGYIYVVGLNLFYYTYYRQDNTLRNLINSILMPYSGTVDIELVKWEDGYIEIRYVANTSFSLLIGEAWFPYWYAYLDGEPIPLYRDSHGLILLRLPQGEHRVILIFRDPYIALRYISLASAIAIAIANLYPLKPRKP